MILDQTLILSDSQAITATAPSTNTIDIGQAGVPFGASTAVGRDLGIGQDIALTLNVTQAFNNLTSLQVTLQSDDTAAFSSPKEIASRTFTLAEINSTKMLPFLAEFPQGSDEQFIRALYTVTGTAPTTGKIFLGVVAGKQQN